MGHLSLHKEELGPACHVLFRHRPNNSVVMSAAVSRGAFILCLCGQSEMVNQIDC